MHRLIFRHLRNVNLVLLELKTFVFAKGIDQKVWDK